VVEVVGVGHIGLEAKTNKKSSKICQNVNFWGFFRGVFIVKVDVIIFFLTC